MANKITFKINGKIYEVGSEVSSDMTLVDYIRNKAELRGTKYMCREGGCGACIVSAVTTKGGKPVAVNSCLVSVTSCQDWEISTVEAVGNKLTGYHPIQTTLAENNGTQCGYCTPGWVCAMYSLVESKKDLTMLEIEKSFGSNICRCTGYRPILDAFKKFATDSPDSLLADIENLTNCKRKGEVCANNAYCDHEDWCVVSNDDSGKDGVDAVQIILKDGKKWFKVKYITDIFEVLSKEGNDLYMLVAGNTAKGAYPILEYPKILIDISTVQELKGYTLDQNLIVGAGVTLTEFLDILRIMAQQEYFEYLEKFHEYIGMVAHIAVRNLGTIAGNLMIKHLHKEFSSDLFVLFETVGAELTIQDRNAEKQRVTMQDFLHTEMKAKIILNVLLPPLRSTDRLVTFKIMPRSQSAHAIVNAGFLYKFDESSNNVSECRLAYGGLSPNMTRATATEELLRGKNLFSNETLQAAVTSLKNELVVTENPPELSSKFRKQLAINLFYKGLLSLCPSESLKPIYGSGGMKVHEKRPVSKGRQIFDTDPTQWPLNQPMPKLEALIQCSGEAAYTEDIPSLPNEVFAAFALSTVPSGTIVSIDATNVLKQPGVIAIYTAKDIPGLNSFTPADLSVMFSANEEVLCSSEVKYYNQPIAIVVAETRTIAEQAAKMVNVSYKNVIKPVIDIKEAKKLPERNTLLISEDAKERGSDVVKVMKNINSIYGQYYMTMETLVCVTKPIEEGLEVHVATHHLDGVQLMISRALKLEQNKIDVYTRRLGGSYGIKISRMTQQAVASSLVTKTLNRPCRFIQSLTTNMRAVGKRFPCSNDFEAAVDENGKIQYLNYNIYEDNGYEINELLAGFGIEVHNNCYDKKTWNYKCYNTITDTAKNSWFRSPGSLENIAMAEYLMEQISYEMSLDPFEVRLNNLDDDQSSDLRDMVELLKTNSQYNERKAAVENFNKENRWMKRGLRAVLMRWLPGGGQILDINLSVYHGDGTVAITHSGIEMGQGINTKAAQICAYLCKIPLNKIQVKGNNTIHSPNSFITGGSITSQNVGLGVKRACEDLLTRLQPIRDALGDPSWEELVSAAYLQNVDLQTHGFVNFNDVQTGNIFGVTVAEVQVDVLTGESEVIRVDLLEDVGQSVNPELDVGQVEGAFIMGLGYWTSEQLVMSSMGEVLTDRTWHYYVPQARDIPQEFNVYFRKNSYSNDAFFGAKAVGEPPMCMSVVVPFAIRAAVVAARADAGLPTTEWFTIDGPYTVEKICLATATSTEHFKFV